MTKEGGWLKLEPGAIVDLIAPGMRPKDGAVEAAVEFLENWGLQARLPRKLLGRDPVCSNTDQARMAHLQDALLKTDSSVIWCLRGGYGSIRLLPALGKMRKPKKTKLIVGLSDITSLQLFAGQNWAWPVLHGSHLDRLGSQKNPPRVVSEIKQILFGEKRWVEFANLKPLNEKALRVGQIKSSLTGGNLVTVQSTIGTPFEIATKGRILFFEDIGERGYRVDRILEHLRQAGLLKGVRAVVFGSFTGGEEADGRKLWKPVLRRFAQSLPFPVYEGLPCGHGYVQRPLPLHTPCELTLGEKGLLRVATGVI